MTNELKNKLQEKLKIQMNKNETQYATFLDRIC
jgi:hypothetical protein